MTKKQSRVVFIICVIVLAASAPGQTAGFTAYTNSLSKYLGIDISWLSVAYCIGTLLSAFCQTKVGAIDKNHKSEHTTVTAGVLLGFALIYMSMIKTITSGVTGIIGEDLQSGVTFVLLTLGFFMLRVFGQGALMMYSRNIPGQYYEKTYSVAAWMSALAIGIIFPLVAQLQKYLISNYECSNAYLIIGGVMIIGYAPIVTFLWKSAPEPKLIIGTSSASSSTEDAGMSRKEAEKTLVML